MRDAIPHATSDCDTMSQVDASDTDPDDWAPAVVFIDTTELRRSPHLEKAGWPEILAWSRLGVVTVVVSTIVIRESQRQLAERRSSETSQLRKIINALGGVASADQIDLKAIEAEASAQAAGYVDWARARLEASGAVVLGLPNVGHDVVLERDFSARRPFNRSGKGYRDTLIWESLLEYLRARGDTPNVLFATSNTDDFAGSTESKLDPSLVADLQPHTTHVRRCDSLREVVDLLEPWASAEAGLSLGDYEQPQDDVEERVIEAVVAAAEEHLAGIEIAVADGYGGSWNVTIQPEIEEPTISAVDVDPESVAVDVYDRYEGDTLAMQATARAHVEIEGFAHKFDLEHLDDDVEILDDDWNDHVMWVQVPRDLGLRFYVTTVAGQIQNLTFDSAGPA